MQALGRNACLLPQLTKNMPACYGLNESIKKLVQLNPTKIWQKICSQKAPYTFNSMNILDLKRQES